MSYNTLGSAINGMGPRRQYLGVTAPAPNLGSLGGGPAAPRGYDPFAGGTTGGSTLMHAIRAHAARSAANQRRRGQVMASLAGLDPWQQQQAITDVGQQAGGQQAQFINEAQLQQLLGEQAFGRTRQLNQEAFDRQKQLLAYQQQLANQNRPGVGSYLGQLAGMGIGAFTGGLGANWADQFFQPKTQRPRQSGSWDLAGQY